MTTLHRAQPGFNVTLTEAFKLTQRFVDIPVGSRAQTTWGSVEGASAWNAAALPPRDNHQGG